MLTLANVTKRYGAAAPAVDGLTLELPAGVVGLVGHNGAGKTTLMQMIATLTRPTSGTIHLDGVDIVRKPAAMRARLGYLPQDFGVYPNLSALEFMQYFAALKGVRDPARIARLLETVNLAQHAHRPAAGFSGGMRRRLGIAQALLNDPDVLVVDEPTAGLDPEERVRFRQLLADLGDRRLVLVSTHIVSDIDSLAAHVAIVRGGRLAAFDTPERLIAGARGRVWSASIGQDEYEALRGRVQVLQAVRQEGAVAVRIAHPDAPCSGARAAEPSLEEALMAQRYAVQEAA